MQQPGWYLQRLKVMSGAEVAHRLARSLRVLSQKFTSNETPPRDVSARDLRFLPPFIAIAPEHLTAAADRILAGKYTFFDLADCDLGDPPQWNRDPLTQRAAGDRRATAIDYRDEREVGNIKYLWEPNRHLHLPMLAQAHALTGDVRYALAIQAQIDSWIEQCPEGWGPNWISPLELGIRLINWSITWQLLGGMRVEAVRDGRGRRRSAIAGCDSIYHQARMIAGNLSRYSSANNHLIGEAAGVYVAASTWPLWPQMHRVGRALPRRSSKRNAIGRTRPTAAIANRPSRYQTFVLDFLLLAGLAARARGEDFSPVYWRRVEVMIDFLASMTSVAGGLPMIGDADDGYVVKLATEPGFSAHISQIATGAVLFGRADLAAKAGALDGKTATLLGVQTQSAGWRNSGSARAARLPAAAAVLRVGLLPDGHRRSTLPTKCGCWWMPGPLGYLSIAAHGHADALSFVLNIGDREILVDPGTYAYHTDPAWRRYFRSTLAHNTVGVDELGSVGAGRQFHVDRPCAGALHRIRDAASIGSDSSASTTAISGSRIRWFTGARSSVDTRRQVIEVIDMLRCDGEHRVRRSWHFAEDCQVERSAAVSRSPPDSRRCSSSRSKNSTACS